MIDWSSIDTVFLDMDGTLLDLNFDNYFWLTHLPQRYAEIHSIDPQEAQEKLDRLIKDQEGTLNWYCVDYWSEALNLDIAQLKEEVADRIAFRPHVIPFLDALKQQGKQRILLTNAHPKSVNLKLSITHLDHHLDKIISSHDLGHAKEHQAFWSELETRLNFDKTRSMLIDDSLPVLESARVYGLKEVLAILTPDSQRPAKNTAGFKAIDHFSSITPSDLNA